MRMPTAANPEMTSLFIRPLHKEREPNCRVRKLNTRGFLKNGYQGLREQPKRKPRRRQQGSPSTRVTLGLVLAVLQTSSFRRFRRAAGRTGPSRAGAGAAHAADGAA